MPRQLVRADFIEQEIHLYAGLGALDQGLLEPHAERVVLHDEEIHAQVVLRLGDGLEDPGEGFLAIDQRNQAVAAGKRQSAENAGRAFEGIVLRDVHFKLPETFVHRLRQAGEALVLGAAAANIQ